MAELGPFLINNKFLMLAFDHRGSFKKLMNPSDPESVTDAEAIELKRKIIDALKDQFSGVLIDTEYGLPAYTEKTKPFLLPIEKTGYVEDEQVLSNGKVRKNGERITELEYGVGKLQEMGAAGAKILLYFNPFVASAEKQLETARKVVEDCKSRDFPLFLEIVTYEPDHEETPEEREKLVIESLKIFVRRNIFPDVFKLEYPGSALSCQTISAALQDTNVPWILLTRGDTFENFKVQLEEATVRGVQGFLAGRSLWQEACSLKGEELEKFLKETLPDRFRQIAEIASSK